MRHSGAQVFPCLLWITVAVLLPGPSQAEIEISPFIGLQVGSVDIIKDNVCAQALSIGCVFSARAEERTAFGLTVDLALNERWMVEVRVSEGSSDVDLDFSSFLFDEESLPDAELVLRTYLIGIQRRWPGQRITPYVVLGGGLTEMEVEGNVLLESFDESGFTASLAAGLKVPIWKLVALRLEARGTWIDLPTSLPESSLTQAEVNSGLSFRF